MKLWRFVGLIAFLGVILAAEPGIAWAQDEGGTAPAQAEPSPPPRSPWLSLGPRVGVGGEIAQPSDFNDTVQRIFPSGHTYFPVYSQIGVDLSEQVPLAQTGFHLYFSQLLTVVGLDQNFALPVLDLLLGATTPFGLEAGLGPQLELADDGSGVSLAPSIVYAVGWRFSFGGVSLPVMMFVDPLPPTRRLRLAVLAGVDYGFTPPAPKPPAPFNY